MLTFLAIGQLIPPTFQTPPFPDFPNDTKQCISVYSYDANVGEIVSFTTNNAQKCWLTTTMLEVTPSFSDLHQEIKFKMQ